MSDRRIVERLREWPLSEKLALEAADRIEALEATLHAAFMAMCAQRDTPDDEVFQDAIDALGRATLAPEPWPQDAIDQEMIERTDDGWKLK